MIQEGHSSSSGLAAAPQAWLQLWALASSLLAFEGWCPWRALALIPAIPTQRLPRRPGEPREVHIGRALGRVAPSMLLCSLSEAICFFLGEPRADPSHSALGLLG